MPKAAYLLSANLKGHLDYVQQALGDADLATDFERAAGLLVAALGNGQKVLVCGNGGSMSDAIHFAEELVGNFKAPRRPFAAIALSDPGNMSCIANDFGYDQVFSRQVEALGQPGDVLVALSTSGNSPNVVAAADQARQKDMRVIGLSAGDGGKLARVAHTCLKGPAHGSSDRIQELHIFLLHTLVEHIENSLLD